MNKKKKMLRMYSIIVLLVIVIVLSVVLIVNRHNIFPNSFSGHITNGNIERESMPVKGKYKEASGTGEFAFDLEYGYNTIYKNVETKSGEIRMELVDENGLVVSDLPESENSVFITNRGIYFLKVYLDKHNGSFEVFIKHQQ